MIGQVIGVWMAWRFPVTFATIAQCGHHGSLVSTSPLRVKTLHYRELNRLKQH